VPHYWVLKNHVPVKADLVTYTLFFRDDANRRVDETIGEGWRVSTVFLGLNHNFARGGRPLLFESMVFDDFDNDERQERYATWDEAVEGHRAIVAEQCAFRRIPIPLTVAELKAAAERVPGRTAWERLKRDKDDF
jgi:hypothetical protein